MYSETQRSSRPFHEVPLVPCGAPAAGPRSLAVRSSLPFCIVKIDIHAAPTRTVCFPFTSHTFQHFPALCGVLGFLLFLLCCFLLNRIIPFFCCSLSLEDTRYSWTILPTPLHDHTTTLKTHDPNTPFRPRFTTIHLRHGFLSEPTAILPGCASIYVRWRS